MGTAILSASAGHRTRIRDCPVNLQLNVEILLGRQFKRSANYGAVAIPAAAAWAGPAAGIGGRGAGESTLHPVAAIRQHRGRRVPRPPSAPA